MNTELIVSGVVAPPRWVGGLRAPLSLPASLSRGGVGLETSLLDQTSSRRSNMVSWRIGRVTAVERGSFLLSPCAGAVETGKYRGSTRKGSGAAEAKAKRTQPRPLPLPQAARLALTQYTNTACVSNTILAYLPRITRNTRSNDLSSLNTKLRLEVGRLYALVPLTYFWKSLLPDSACVQSRRSPLTNRAS